jgi:hypothetical protein
MICYSTCLLLLVIGVVQVQSAWWIDGETERLTLAGERQDAEWVRQWMIQHQASQHEEWQQKALYRAACAAVSLPDPDYQQEKAALLVQIIVDGRPDMSDHFSQQLCLIGCGYGYYNVVKALLLRGIDANCTDGEGRTPLTEAANCGNTEIVSLLLQYGAKPDAAAAASARSGMALYTKQEPGITGPASKRNRARYTQVLRFLLPDRP